MKKITEYLKNNKIRSCTTLCFVFLMLINRVVANESQYIWLITNNLIGPAIVLVILSIYPVKDFLKPFYIIWTVLGVLGTIGGYGFWYTHQVGHYIFACVTVPLNIWILGGAVIKYFEEIVLKKSFKIHISKWEIPFIACMLLMFFSASNTVWPFYYLIIFLLLWHTPFSREDKRNVFMGMMDGLIAGFIVMQCIAFMNTPYQTPRYRGAFWNCNRNSCLYLLALASTFGKAHMYKMKKSGESDKSGRKALIAYGCIASVLIAFIIYTGSRTGLIGTVLIAFLYFVCERNSFKERIRVLITKGIVYTILAIVFVPVLYFPIRYLPEVKPYLITVAKNVIKGPGHEFVPVSGLDFNYAITYNLLRYFEIELPVKEEETASVAEDVEVVEAEVVDTDVVDVDVEPEEEISVTGVDPTGRYYTLNYTFMYYPERGMYITKVPAYLYTGMNTIDSRINIAAALIDQMNLWGHLDNEIILDIYSDVPGTGEAFSHNEQNFIIHFLYVYGVPVGILVCVLLFAELVWLIRRSISGKGDATVLLMLVSVYFFFGIMEIVWVPGQIEQLLLFFVPLFFTPYDNCVSERQLERE